MRVHRKSWKYSNKRGTVEGGGGGEAKGNRDLHDFEKLRLPKNAVSSWRGIMASQALATEIWGKMCPPSDQEAIV